MDDRIPGFHGRGEPAEAVLERALRIASGHEATIHVLDVVETIRAVQTSNWMSASAMSWIAVAAPTPVRTPSWNSSSS